MRRYIVSGTVLILLLVIVGICLHQRRPLVQTDEWEASVTFQSGSQIEIPVYKMWGFPDRRFIELPSNMRQRYHWFAIDTLGVSDCFGVGNIPYKHLNHDMSLGISLDDPKIEDEWSIKWQGENVKFSNADLEISVKR